MHREQPAKFPKVTKSSASTSLRFDEVVEQAMPSSSPLSEAALAIEPDVLGAQGDAAALAMAAAEKAATETKAAKQIASEKESAHKIADEGSAKQKVRAGNATVARVVLMLTRSDWLRKRLISRFLMLPCAGARFVSLRGLPMPVFHSMNFQRLVFEILFYESLISLAISSSMKEMLLISIVISSSMEVYGCTDICVYIYIYYGCLSRVMSFFPV